MCFSIDAVSNKLSAPHVAFSFPRRVTRQSSSRRSQKYRSYLLYSPGGFALVGDQFTIQTLRFLGRWELLFRNDDVLFRSERFARLRK